MSNHRFRLRGHHRVHARSRHHRGVAPWLRHTGRLVAALGAAALAVITPLVVATAGTPGSDAGNGAWVGGKVFTAPFEPLVLWKLPGSGGRLGTCIEADANGPLHGPYSRHSTVADPVYAELNHLYARAETSDVQLAELSALNSRKYDRVNRALQWSYLVNGQGGTSVAGANAMLARATALAGPYTVAVNWPAADTKTDTSYTATVTVTSANGTAVPGVAVTLSGTNVTLATRTATTDSAGHALVGFRIPVGTSAGITIAASVQSWTTVDIYQSTAEQSMLVAGSPGTQSGQHSGAVTRQRPVYLVKVAAHDATHSPVPGYTFEITDANGAVVIPSITTGASTTAAPLGTLVVGATYHAHESSAPPGGPLYIPVAATTTFVVPSGTGTWVVEAADPEMPTPTIVTHVMIEHPLTGEPLVDEVTVAGDDGENGTIDATLYGPVPPPPSGNCADLTLTDFTSAPTHQSSTAVSGATNNGNGTYRVVAPVPGTAGCWGWGETLRLQPSGATASSPPTAANESSLVTTPHVETTVSTQVAAVGVELTDRVVVSGMNGQPGTLDAVLYGPLAADPRAGCTQYTGAEWTAAIARGGPALVTATATLEVSGDGTYVTSPVRLTRTGCYTYRETLTPHSTPSTPVVTPPGVPSESTIVLTPQIRTQAVQSTRGDGDVLRDRVVVTGTAGRHGTIGVSVLGPVADRSGSCAGLDWSGARVAAPPTTISVTGDATYDTAAVTVRAAGCYTFVETLTLDGSTDPFVRTTAGIADETVLVRRTAPGNSGPPLARTGTSALLLGGGGAVAVGGGSALLVAGRRRR